MDAILATAWDASTADWVTTAFLRLLLAAGLGAVVGLEREFRGRHAGFRTQLLVSLGSALAMLVSLNFARVFGDVVNESIRVDPARVAYGVMGGIGFLGAGAIIKYGAGVRGLTTAAGLWCNAAVGLACGMGMVGVAVSATGIILFTLVVLSKLDEWIPSRIFRTVVLELPRGSDEALESFRAAMKAWGVHELRLGVRRDVEQGTDRVTIEVSMSARLAPTRVLASAEQLPGLKSAAIT